MSQPTIPDGASDEDRYETLKKLEGQQVAECDDPACELCAYVRARDEGQN